MTALSPTRLSIHYGPGFTADLWSWKVELRQAVSGRVDVVFETKSFEPRARREHRFRARTLPVCWSELNDALAQINFEALPPATKWAWLDDAAPLSIELRQHDVVTRCGIFFAPEHWPVLPGNTRKALQDVVSLLDPLARQLHTGEIEAR